MSIVKKIFSACLGLCCAINMFCSLAFAIDDPIQEVQTICYEDGSYTVITITYDVQSVVSAISSVKKTGGEKEYTYYSGSRQALWTFRVHGTFEYDGSSASATSADYSQEVYDSAWSFDHANAYCSGASAIAEGTFKLGVIPISTTVTLTCSKDGKLS